MVCASNPTAIAFVKSAGNKFTRREIIKIIDKKSKEL